MDENNNGVNYGPDPIGGATPNPDPMSGVGQQYVNPNQQPPVYDSVGPNTEGQGSNGMAIGSLVCGILSIVGSCWCCGLNLILAIVGLVLGIIGKKKAGKSGMALAGIICSVIGLIISIIYTIYVIVVGVSGSMEPTYYYNY